MDEEREEGQRQTPKTQKHTQKKVGGECEMAAKSRENLERGQIV